MAALTSRIWSWRLVCGIFTRNTALIDLAGELPAAVLAKLLGLSIKRAVTWSEAAGNTRPRYAAEVARRTS
ncbi:hypothetical protein [Mycobacterium avium]|uniref:hypothetical protein n=1 Tax=Mycobacterium avium TaxID=1764 RepID=UPI0012DA2431|nr:hypothetical protein [Mycobacterium avium]